MRTTVIKQRHEPPELVVARPSSAAPVVIECLVLGVAQGRGPHGSGDRPADGGYDVHVGVDRPSLPQRPLPLQPEADQRVEALRVRPGDRESLGEMSLTLVPTPLDPPARDDAEVQQHRMELRGERR